ncbi:MAG: DUF4114 domain-containing protein [Pseudomonadota bacterium]
MADFLVTTDQDIDEDNDDELSLREAIAAANAAAGPSTIGFAPDLDGATLVLTQGELVITDDVTITGPGADRLAIDGGGNSRVFAVDDGDETTQRHVVLEDLTITGGRVINDYPWPLDQVGGGGILNREALEVHRSIIRDNFIRSYPASDGAGIFNDGGSVILSHSSLLKNDARHDGYYYAGRGGGIASHGGYVNIYYSTISGNYSSGDTGGSKGGGIYIRNGELNITSSTIAENSAVGGFNPFVTWSNIFGGGIFSYNSNLSVINSTIAANEAESPSFGGYQSQFGPQGGGIFVFGGTNTITNTTIVDNMGGGVLSAGTTTVTTVASSLIANNAGEEDDYDVWDTTWSGGSPFRRGTTFVSGGDNLISNGDADAFVDGSNGDIVGTAAAPVDPGLAAAGLEDNGGPTRTIALLPTSPAVDAGSNPLALAVDQRGKGFERTVGDLVDVGAFEVQVPVAASSRSVAVVAEDARFANLFGWYDEATGQAAILFADSLQAADFATTLVGVEADTIGFFLVPDGGDDFAAGGRFAGVDPATLELELTAGADGYVLTTEDGMALWGRPAFGAPAAPLAYFTDSAKNPGGVPQVEETGTGLIRWEDLANGGDRDFDDLVIRTGRPITIEIKAADGGFDNLLGWYDSETGAAEILAVDAGEVVGTRLVRLVPDPARVEFFLVPDGADAFGPGGAFDGVDPTTLDLQVVETAGRFVVANDTGETLLGRPAWGAEFEALAFFSEFLKNPDGIAHAATDDGVIGWEDLFGGGDQDLDDLLVAIDLDPPVEDLFG